MNVIVSNKTSYSIDETILHNIANEVQNHFELDTVDIGVVFVDNKAIREYNKQYRNKDYPTDVLTFPDGTEEYLGDVIISLEKCKEQAIEYNHSFDRELGFLFVHGILHTLGYDHQTKEDEEVMFTLQDTILKAVKLTRNKVK